MKRAKTTTTDETKFFKVIKNDNKEPQYSHCEIVIISTVANGKFTGRWYAKDENDANHQIAILIKMGFKENLDLVEKN